MSVTKGNVMLYLTTVAIYVSVFAFSLCFYSSKHGAKAIYFGFSALLIDIMAILAGFYAIWFSFMAYDSGLSTSWVLGTIVVGAVVSAMHLAKWVVR